MRGTRGAREGNRKQYTVLNGIASDLNTVKSGIPQGSVLGPTLFSLYTSNLPEAITTATTYMYADDTTLYCIGDSIDAVISELNKALEELLYRCKTNSLVPVTGRFDTSSFGTN